MKPKRVWIARIVKFLLAVEIAWLVLANLFRNKTRTALTTLSVAVAFFLFNQIRIATRYGQGGALLESGSVESPLT